jgi:TldD protein
MAGTQTHRGRRPLKAIGGAAVLTALLWTGLPARSAGGAEGAAPLTAGDELIFRALNDELGRSMKELVLPGMGAPYFLAYRLRDEQGATVEARYTALTDTSTYRSRQLHIDLRVGDPALDNTGFFQDWRDIWPEPARLVEENSYSALRHELWLATDGVYKSALESLARKKAYFQAHPPKKVLFDFAPAEPFVYLGPESAVRIDRAGATNRVRRAADAFLGYPALQDWKVSCSARSINQWYVNSEGSKHRKGIPRSLFEMSATLQAADGQRISGSCMEAVRGDAPLPSAEMLAKEAGGLAADLQAMAQAAPLEEYVGPVLFTGYDSAQFVSQLFAAQLGLPRKQATVEDWMSQYLPLGKLAARVKRRVLPAFVSISDQPRLESWGGKLLLGTQAVDDEGVPCSDITLVENGRLINLPMSRQPVEGFDRSNGHARSLPQQRVVPGISNLVVSTSDPWTEDKLVGELQAQCREQGLEFGLLIKRLEETRFTDMYRQVEQEDNQPTLLTPPLIVYKVYAKDGRTEPVRGLGFDEVTVRSLRDITALGKDGQLYNVYQRFPGLDVTYLASIITPSILVEEMELKSVAVHEPLMVEKNPLFK